MIINSLVCMLYQDKQSSFKTTTVSANPSLEKIREVYFNNTKVLQYVLDYCFQQNIKSLRVSSSLFPLSTHEMYRDKVFPILQDVLSEYQKLQYHDIHLSVHPDQFILISSDNDEVNARSRYELNLNAYISDYLPFDLINIHVGSTKLGKPYHKDKFLTQFKLLDEKTKKLLSIENDEKGYCFEETLLIAQESGAMIVPDFHHERCYQKRKLKENNFAPYHDKQSLNKDEHYVLNKEIDKAIIKDLDKVIKTYHNKKAIPTFHLSSPICGWNDNFREHCAHSDYIDFNDYPTEFIQEIESRKIDIRLDIEAKAKNLAVLKLTNDLASLK